MLIKGRIKVFKRTSTNGYETVYLKVRFKLPNSVFPVSDKIAIVSECWIGDLYKNKEEYWENLFYKLNQREYLERVAKSLIVDYIKRKRKTTDDNIKSKQLDELIKSVNKDFEVEVKDE